MRLIILFELLRNMEPLHLLPAVSGSSGPRRKETNLPVPVMKLPAPPKRPIPRVDVMKNARSAPKTKMPYGMIGPVKDVRDGVPHEYTG